MNIEEPIIIGRDWYYEPRGWLDVVRCLLGRHREIMTSRLSGAFIGRCSCGAMRVNRRHWFDAHPFTRRKEAE